MWRRDEPDPQPARQVLSNGLWPHRLTPIFPLVVYHGEQTWNIPADFAALVDAPDAWRTFVPNFTYALQDLSTGRNEQFGDEPLLRAALEVFKRIYDRLLVGDIPDILAVFEEVYWDVYVQDFLFAMLNYIAAANPYISEEDLKNAIARLSPKLGENIMQTLAERWIEQGIEQGARRELLESIKAGLEVRFGAEGLFLLREISKIDTLTLLRAVNVALFRVTSLDELRRVYQPGDSPTNSAEGQDPVLN